MITLEIKSQLPTAIRWTDAMVKQLPWAVAKAMTESAKKAQIALKAQTPRYIDRPTPFTLNSTFVRYANPKNLEAWVGFKDFAPKGTPAAKYLQPMVGGGIRSAKSTERQLQAAGLLRPGQFITPVSAGQDGNVPPLKVNQYGNLTGATYTQVLSRLVAFGEQGYTANVSSDKRSQAKRRQRDYFIGRPGGLPLGIYARLGKRPKNGGLARGFHTAFYVTRQPMYRPTFPVEKILSSTFNNTFGPNLRNALQAELAYQASRNR